MKFFSDCTGDCCVCYLAGMGCLAGHGDDDYTPATKEQVIERLEKGKYPDCRNEMKGYLLAKFSFVYEEKRGESNLIGFTIPGKLPGLNEYIAAERENKYQAAKLKRETEKRIILAAKQQLHGIKFSCPVIMHYTWYEQNRRRDKDNIAFAKKFVQDALVKCGVLKNDGWEEIEDFTDKFVVDKNNLRVEVRFEELENG